MLANSKVGHSRGPQRAASLPRREVLFYAMRGFRLSAIPNRIHDQSERNRNYPFHHALITGCSPAPWGPDLRSWRADGHRINPDTARRPATP
jgi:hypothetical protein